MSIAALEVQASLLRQRIKELEAELEGLDEFENQVEKDSIGFQGKLQAASASTYKASGLANSKSAQGYFERMNAALGVSFQDGVYACFDGVSSQIGAATGQIEEEINQINAQIINLEEQMQEEQERQMREQLRREREADEACRRAAAQAYVAKRNG